MGMPIELNTMIVTKGKEERAEQNLFCLKKDGYRMYPLHIPVEVRKTINSDISGIAVIQKLVWENDQTHLTYELQSLNSTN
ncbi:DUF2584 domain-containing protein [Bacillus sp. 2205SS5-2]|uniref:DUF2584 domain-containing protein n=1 Tax=Bacillus sp. 2205SS5-2 TaxID=3109031 RepID=UPI003006A4B4